MRRTFFSFVVILGLAAICQKVATQNSAFGQDEKPAVKARRIFDGDFALANLMFAPDRKNLIFSVSQTTKKKGEFETQLVLFDPRAGKELRCSPPFLQKFGLQTGFFSANGKMLVFKAWGGDPLVWDLEKWEIKQRLNPIAGHLGNRRPIGISHNGRILLGSYQTTDYKKGSLVRLDLRTGVHSVVGQETYPGPGKARFLEGSDTLVLAEYNFGYNQGTYLWDLAKKNKLPTEIFRVPGNEGVLSGKERFVLAPSGRVVVLPNYRQPALTMNAPGNGTINLFGGGKHRDQITDFRGAASLYSCLSEDGALLAASGPNQFGSKVPGGSRLLVWDLIELKAAAEKDSQPKNPGDVKEFMDELFARPKPDKELTIWEYPAQVKNHAVMRALVARPKETVAGIKKHLGTPAGKGDLPKIAQWIKDLNSSRFTERKKAQDELKRVPRAAQHLMQQVLKDNPSLEHRSRLEAILGTIPSVPAVELQMVLVIDVLAAIDSIEAREVLRAIADGGYGEVFAAVAERALQGVKTPLKQ